MTTPRFAAAALVAQREVHSVNASGTFQGVDSHQSFPGDTTSPTSPVVAAATAPGSNATLNLAFNGQGVVASLASNSAIGPVIPGVPVVSSTSGDSSFTLTFTVTEPTPFQLSGTLRGFGTFTPGFASVRLADDTTIYDVQGTNDPHNGDTIHVSSIPGTFMPGHTITLTATTSSSAAFGPLGRPQGVSAAADITLTVPEPTSAALLAPAALLLLGRRRRQRDA